MPREKGQIATLVCVCCFSNLGSSDADMEPSYHAGKTKDGMDFEAYLGKDKFETLMSNEFDAFLHQAFSMQCNLLLEQETYLVT